MKKTGTYDIVYQVKDASNNIASVTRKVQVCKDPTTTKLYYNHDDYDNTAEEWWFNKSKEHKRTTDVYKRQQVYILNTLRIKKH